MSRQSTTTLNEHAIVLHGYHKKLKTMKKKYFVLYKETACESARLVYYDSEKKFKSGAAPKRVIKLEQCFNINRRLDTKYEYVIALSTKDGGFGIVLETETEMLQWLENLIEQQRKDSQTCEYLRPNFDHVWQVVVQTKGLAEEKGITGSYYICLTAKSITFMRIGAEKTAAGERRVANIEFNLTTIRRCGDSHCFFYMEVGRQSVIGQGELWMETENSLIAKNMHQMILKTMSGKSDINLEPMRKRSSSANEASKPNIIIQKRQTQIENKIASSPQSTASFGRDRCDSLPSRNRCRRECNCQSNSVDFSKTISGNRQQLHHSYSSSPPMKYNFGGLESAESSASIDESDDTRSFLSHRFNSRSTEGVIHEENSNDLCTAMNKRNDSENNLSQSVKSGCSIKSGCQKDENYAMMTSTSFCEEPNITKHVPSAVPYRCDADASEPSPSPQSDEYKMDALPKRAMRPFPLGNKYEHIKNIIPISYVCANQSTTRVRAFSVGSRAKTPFCDLQRDILFSKAMVKKYHSSNNNICFADNCVPCSQVQEAAGYKKSTSTPHLMLKSTNSIHEMGDLMEIDFTNSSRNASKLHSPVEREQQMCVVDSSKMAWRSEPQELPHKLASMPSNNATLAVKSAAAVKADNGYLEMKPSAFTLTENGQISTCHSRTNSNSNEYLEKKSAALSKDVKKKACLQSNNNSSNEILNAVCNAKNINGAVGKTEHNKMPQHLLLKTKTVFGTAAFQRSQTPNAKLYSEELSKKQATKTQNLSTNYEEILTTKTKSFELPNENKNDYTNFCRNCNRYKAEQHDGGERETLANNDSKKCECIHEETPPPQKREQDSKIPNLKTENSLQLHNALNRSTQQKIKPWQLQPQIRPKSSNTLPATAAPPSSASTLLDFTASSNSSLNSLTPQAETPNETLNERITKTNSTISGMKASSNISRPPSITLEHELYYAKLDLPHCNSDSVKVVKADASAAAAVAVADFPSAHCNPNSNNTYAKIDFDLSDSSSSSSKNFNV